MAGRKHVFNKCYVPYIARCAYAQSYGMLMYFLSFHYHNKNYCSFSEYYLIKLNPKRTSIIPAYTAFTAEQRATVGKYASEHGKRSCSEKVQGGLPIKYT